MASQFARRMACLFSLTLIPSLYAVDGTTLIDQQRARLGNVSPDDTPGFPITISVSGSYRLSSNLIVPDIMTTAIQITADDVTIDLNGFTIRGPVVCTSSPAICGTTGQGVGIHAGSFSPGVVAPRGVKVMNGTVRGMGFHGVRLMGDATVVERVTAHSNAGPGIVVGVGSVIDSNAVMNGGAGIIASVVRGSTASQNANSGIFVRDHGIASNNMAYFNAIDGIIARYATLKANAAGMNKGSGINITCPASVVDNTAVGNLMGGIKSTGLCSAANNAQ
jgi:hypothetical protein